MAHIRRAFRTMLVLGLLAVSLSVATTKVSAATLEVTIAADVDGAVCGVNCSLRQAVNVAELTSEPDLISLVDPGPFILDAALGDLNVTTPITIEPSDSVAPRTIEGGVGFADRIFSVTGGDLTITRLFLRKGAPNFAADDKGGAVRVIDGTLVMNSGRIALNTADIGGGIYGNANSTITLNSNASIEENVATLTGGGIDTEGDLTGRQLFLEDNDATSGGGLAFHGGTGSITLSNGLVIAGNQATGDGGALFIEGGGPVSISGGGIFDNDALGTVGGDGTGGAIHAGAAADVTVTGASVRDNDSNASGGAIFNAGDMTVDRTEVVVNDANGDNLDVHGGGIMDTGTLTVSNTTISGNRAEDSGGGIFSTADPTITNSTISDNEANAFPTADLNGDGGGVSGTVPNSWETTGSIIFGNDDVQEVAETVRDDCGANVIDSNGGNVFANTSLCPTGQPGDSSSDPQLAALASDPPTGRELHALPATSPALDLNDVDGICGGFDQRGLARPSNENCDAGAYERVLCDGLLPTQVGFLATTNGTAGSDVIVPFLTVTRTINGLGGDDRICGGETADVLRGGDGNDRIFANGGKDKLFGDAGSDYLNGGKKKDKCKGGPGKDKLKKCEIKRR